MSPATEIQTDEACPQAVQAFRDHVTRVAFQLTLSRPMIRFLLKLDRAHRHGVENLDDGYGKRGDGLNIVDLSSYEESRYATWEALTRRGLVEHRLPATVESLRGHYLTEAGRALIPLLKLAGFGS